MQPGDMLFLPQGVVHSARASEDGATHITFGRHRRAMERARARAACMMTWSQLTWNLGVGVVGLFVMLFVFGQIRV